MGHVDWLVDREGVMFAPDLPEVPADDSSDADKAIPEPNEADRSDEDDSEPEDIEVGDPRDGP